MGQNVSHCKTGRERHPPSLSSSSRHRYRHNHGLTIGKENEQQRCHRRILHSPPPTPIPPSPKLLLDDSISRTTASTSEFSKPSQSPSPPTATTNDNTDSERKSSWTITSNNKQCDYNRNNNSKSTHHHKQINNSSSSLLYTTSTMKNLRNLQRNSVPSSSLRTRDPAESNAKERRRPSSCNCRDRQEEHHHHHHELFLEKRQQHLPSRQQGFDSIGREQYQYQLWSKKRRSEPVKVQRPNRRNLHRCSSAVAPNASCATTTNTGRALLSSGQHNGTNDATTPQDPHSYLQRMYDSRTWEMYRRITTHRDRTKSNSSWDGSSASSSSISVDSGTKTNDVNPNNIIETTASADQQSTMSEPVLLHYRVTTATSTYTNKEGTSTHNNNNNAIMIDDDDYALGGGRLDYDEYDHLSAPVPCKHLYYISKFHYRCDDHRHDRQNDDDGYVNENNDNINTEAYSEWEHMYGLDDDLCSSTGSLGNNNNNGLTTSHQQHETVFLFDF